MLSREHPPNSMARTGTASRLRCRQGHAACGRAPPRDSLAACLAHVVVTRRTVTFMQIYTIIYPSRGSASLLTRGRAESAPEQGTRRPDHACSWQGGTSLRPRTARTAPLPRKLRVARGDAGAPRHWSASQAYGGRLTRPMACVQEYCDSIDPRM